MEAKFTFPDYYHQEALESFVRDMIDNDHSSLINGSGSLMQHQNNFNAWIKKEKEMHLGIHMDDGFVPGTTFLYILDEEIIGIINIRHCLNDYLLNAGGHIGYSIRPQYRKQGYATKMLKEALKYCEEWEITPVLVTCDEDNIASRKTIEKCGGILENKYRNGEETILRFWIGENQ